MKPNGVTIGDLDGDGKPEIVVAIDHDTVSVFRNTSTPGNISFANKINFVVSIGEPQTISINDFDLDGKPDLAISYSTSTTLSLASVLRNTSSPGAFTFLHHRIIRRVRILIHRQSETWMETVSPIS